MEIDAIVLAGAINNGKLQEISSCEHEAMILINGKPMVGYVVETLQRVSGVRQMAVVGPDELRPIFNGTIPIIKPGETLADSIKNGLDYLNTSRMVLLVTADIPLVSEEALEDFLLRCSDLDGDLFYPVVSKEANDKLYPGVERTYVQLKEGTFTGGNIFLIAPAVIENCHAIIRRAIALRKKPIQLSRLLGISFIIKLLLHSLSISEIEKRVKAIFEIKGVAVISPYPEIGIDVDKTSDWQLAEDLLSKAE